MSVCVCVQYMSLFLYCISILSLESLVKLYLCIVCVCVAARPVVELKACVPQMTMTVASVMHHVYRNSMDRGTELAWLIATGVESDPSDITLHVTPIDFH